MITQTVVGAPVWDRAWSLPLWFQSVRANVVPATTGLVFVVPPTDTATRDAIAALSSGFRWVEVLRDRGQQSRRAERQKTGHQTLAAARNQLLRVVEHARPRRYISWDTDFLVPPGSVDAVAAQGAPLATCWAWLNRQPPRSMVYEHAGEQHDVRWQEPVRATAMAWDPRTHGTRPMHYPADEFLKRSRRTWPCDVALAWQVMDERAYLRARYAPHPDGEDVPFNATLAAQGVERLCVGLVRGVHLYDETARDEIAMGWPQALGLGAQIPLAAQWRGERPPEYTAFGFYPREEDDGHRVAA